jgi:hypothetical protein
MKLVYAYFTLVEPSVILYLLQIGTVQNGVAVTLWTCISEELGLKSGGVTGYSD